MRFHLSIVTLMTLALVGLTPTPSEAATTPLAKKAQQALRPLPTASLRPDGSAGSVSEFVELLDGLSWGSAQNAVLNFATNPTNGDTVTIGDDIYEFNLEATDDDISADTRIYVKIDTTVALTRALFVAAINADDPDNLHPTGDLSTGLPAKANGTENVVARVISNTIQIRSADQPGGTVTSSNESILLAQGLTHAADVWLTGDVNMNTLGGADPAPYGASIQCKTITADMIANTVRYSFPFAVTGFITQTRDATGALRMDDDLGLTGDLFTIANGDVLVTFDGGAAPDIQADDVVCVVAFP